MSYGSSPGRSRSALSSQWLWLFSLCFLAFAALSTQRLQALEDPWVPLKISIDNLPTAISDWQKSLIGQVTQLRSRNRLLTDSLESSQSNVDSLQKQNKDLESSLNRSKAEATTSSAALRLSQTALTASLQSTTKLEKQAKALELQNKILKWSLGGVALAGVVYFGGKAAHIW